MAFSNMWEALRHGGGQVVRRVEQAAPRHGTPSDITPQGSADLSDGVELPAKSLDDTGQQLVDDSAEPQAESLDDTGQQLVDDSAEPQTRSPLQAARVPAAQEAAAAQAAVRAAARAAAQKQARRCHTLFDEFPLLPKPLGGALCSSMPTEMEADAEGWSQMTCRVWSGDSLCDARLLPVTCHLTGAATLSLLICQSLVAGGISGHWALATHSKHRSVSSSSCSRLSSDGSK